MTSPFARFRRLFWRQARKIQPSVGRLKLKISGDPAEFPQVRNYAYTTGLPGGLIRVVFSPKIFDAPLHRALALIRHELAHALLLYQGVDHSERQCDAVAEALWNCRIYYDSQDVQSIRSGTRPRPAYLPR